MMKETDMSPTRSKGFTLIELLIVIAIIAILALIAIPNFLEAQTRAKVSRAQADMRSLATAIEAYAQDYSIPPWTANEDYAVPHWQDTEPPSRVGNSQPWHTQWIGWRKSLQRLTTPMAYVTSIMPDPFQEKNQDTIRASDGKPVFNDDCFIDGRKRGQMTYRYEQSPESFGTGFALGPNYNKRRTDFNIEFHQTNWLPANGASHWMLMSSGPDCDSFTGYREPFDHPIFNGQYLTAGCAPGTMLLVPWPLGNYDPTNGSISWGAIRRTDSTDRSN